MKNKIYDRNFLDHNVLYMKIPGTRKTSVCYKFTDNEITEYLKCKKDVLYFANRYILGGILDSQKEIIYNFSQNRINYLQHSTYIEIELTLCICALHSCMFIDDSHVLMLSLYTKNLCIFKKLYEDLPFFLKSGIVRYNKIEVIFENGSNIKITNNAKNSIGRCIDSLYVFNYPYGQKYLDSMDILYPSIRSLKNSTINVCFENNLMKGFKYINFLRYNDRNIQKCEDWQRDLESDDEWEDIKYNRIYGKN